MGIANKDVVQGHSNQVIEPQKGTIHKKTQSGIT